MVILCGSIRCNRRLFKIQGTGVIAIQAAFNRKVTKPMRWSCPQWHGMSYTRLTETMWKVKCICSSSHKVTFLSNLNNKWEFGSHTLNLTMESVTDRLGPFTHLDERTIHPTFICRPTNAALPGMPVHDGSQCAAFSSSPFVLKFDLRFDNRFFFDCPQGCHPLLLVHFILQHLPLPVNIPWKCF